MNLSVYHAAITKILPIVLSSLAILSSQVMAEELPNGILNHLKSATTFVKIDDARKMRGSGFFIENDIVVTNVHVLGMSKEKRIPPQRIQLVLMSGQPSERTIEASILDLDYQNDLAFLRVPQQNGVKPLEMRKSESISETLPVYILGFPLAEGLDLRARNPSITVSTGSISSLRRNEHEKIEELQINGNVIPGNSGGPIVDAHGELVGVTRAAILGLGVGFSIPSDMVAADLQGRIAAASFTHEVQPKDSYSVDISITTIDPSKKIKRLAAYYWISPINSVRPLDEKDKFPTYGAQGDGAKKHVELKFDAKLGQWTGKIKSLQLSPNQDIWIQPAISTAKGLKLVGAINHSNDMRKKVINQVATPDSPSPAKPKSGPNSEPKAGVGGIVNLTPRFVPAPKLPEVKPITPPLTELLEAEKLKDKDGYPYALVKSTATKVKIGDSEIKQLLADPHGDKVYAILANEPDVLVIDPLDLKNVRRITVPKSPVHMWCDSRRLVVACGDSRVVVTIDTNTLEVSKSVRIKGEDSLQPERVVGDTPDGSIVSVWKKTDENRGFPSNTVHLITPSGSTQQVTTGGAMQAREIQWCVLLSRKTLWIQSNFGGSPSGAPFVLSLDNQTVDYSGQLFGKQGSDMHRSCGHCFLTQDGKRFLIPTESRGLVKDAWGYSSTTLVVKPDLSEQLLQLEGTVLCEYPVGDCFVSWKDGRTPDKTNASHEILYLSRSSGRVVRRVVVSRFDPHPAIFVYHRLNPSAIFLPGLESLWVRDPNSNEGTIHVIQCGPIAPSAYVPTDPTLMVINAPPKLAFVGKPFAFTPDFSASDNAKSVKFKLEKGVTGMKIDEKTGKISFEPSDANLGIYSIVVVAEVDGVRVPVINWDLEIDFPK